MRVDIGRRSALEAIGTFWLVLGGCGTAVLAGKSVGTLGISLAFGLTVLTMAYAIGSITGCHLNPAVTIGLVLGRRFDAKEAVPYILAQIVGAIAAIGVLAVILSGLPGWKMADETFAANGYKALSPGGFGIGAALVTEIVMTFMFLLIILGSTDARAPKGFAPIAIGLGLTLIHLISIPVTNTSVNPARSIAPAIFAGGDYLGQLWLFIVGPVIGAALAGFVYVLLLGDGSKA